jgi:membrane-associated phospholipid phosphatase
MIRFIFFSLFIGISVSGFSQNTDISILRSINLQRNKSLDPAFKLITSSVAPFEIAAPATFVALYLSKKDSAANRKAIFLCSSFAFSTAVTTCLKFAVKRDRPFITYPDIEKLTAAGSLSFPSGHTSSAFSLATSLSLIYPKWYVIAPSFLWASSVGYSRMHLGVHYPSDVLAGAIIGSGTAWLSYELNNYFFKRIQRSNFNSEYKCKSMN